MKKTFLLSSVIVACIYLMAGCGVDSESGVSESRSKDGSDSDFVPDPVTVTDSEETDSEETVYSLRFDITDAIAFVVYEKEIVGEYYSDSFIDKVLADGRVSRMCFVDGHTSHASGVNSVYQYPSSITQDMIIYFNYPFVKLNNSGGYTGYGELLRIHSDNTFEDIIGVKGGGYSLGRIANDADGNLYYLTIDDSNTGKLAIYKYAVRTKQKTLIIGGLSRFSNSNYDYWTGYDNFSVTKDGTYIMFKVYEENDGKIYIIPVENSTAMQRISNVNDFCYDGFTDSIFFEEHESLDIYKIDLNNNFQRSIVNEYDSYENRIGFDFEKVLITSYGIWGIISDWSSSNGNTYSFIKVFNGDRTWNDVTTIGIPDGYSFNYDDVKNVDDVIYLSASKSGVYRIYKMDSTGLSQPLLEVSGRNFSWDCNGRYILYSITTNATLTESSVTINKLKNLQIGEEIAIDENSVLNNIHLLK